MALSDALSNLSDVLNQQYYTGENKNKTAQLGSFANSYDRSAQRSYTEEGYFRNHSADNVVKQLDIITQQPEATILVKKRAFSSLAENFRPDLMDADESLFYRATKQLFKNKAKQIASYEMLTKIAQVSTSIGEVDYHLLPIIFGATDALSSIGVGLGKFGDTVNRIRQILAFNGDSKYTTWVSNPADNFKNSFGEGTGVLEFNTVSNFTTTTSLQFNGGQFSLNFADPYNLMKIRHNDIEAAIADLTSLSSTKSFNLLNSVAQDTIDIQQRQLNALRAGRGVYGIRFIVDPGTFVGKRITALIDDIGFEIIFNSSSVGNLGLGNGTSIDPSALQGADGVLEQGLDKKEVSLFSNIVSAMYNSLSLMENTKRSVTTDNTKKNESVNRLRRRLRLHYQGKLVLQPMDTISIFVNSKKQQDIKVESGLQSAVTGMNFLNGVSGLLNGISDTLNAYKGYSIEKAIFVGPDFPNPLWLAFRSQFVSDKQGCCIFTGVFDHAESNYSSGTHTVSANGKDNSSFFERGIINRNPSMDVYNGTLFDPLTPFEQKYDSVTGVADNSDPKLLDENKSLFQSAFVRNPNGPLAGAVATESGYFNKTVTGKPISASSDRLPFYDPEGLVYRWKEGIATLVLFGDSYQADGANKLGASITVDPFAGQDIMNVISLMITGEPYNYATFYKATTQFNTITRDPITGLDSASSYFRGLRAQIKNNNAIYGNFIPFKRLTMDEASFEKIINGQVKITAQDSDLERLTSERAALADRLALFSGDGTATASIQADLNAFDALIQTRMTEISSSLNEPGHPLYSIVGDDVSFASSDSLSVNGQSLDNGARRELRKKIRFLTRRLAWKVRGNEDQNLFIVDDTYDKDYDIQQFEKQINNFSLYKSDYTTAATQIKNAADKLQLEIFCNTQGHIEIRNPKYNNIPSSVFNRMLRQKNETGVQVFPQFLQDLFTTQLNDLYKNIEILEDQIRLYCYALGYTDDTMANGFINGVGGGISIGSVGNSFGSTGGFAFISNPSTGKIDPVAFGGITIGDNTGDVTNQKLGSQSNISVFSAADRANFTITQNSTFKSLAYVQNIASSSTYFADITARLKSKTGQSFNLSQEFGQDSNAVVKTSTSNVANLQLINKIAPLISQRQSAIKTATNAIKNLQEGASLASQDGASNLLFPSTTMGNKVPMVLEHMIEDESYDDLGIGSKSRYVIKNHDIITYSSSENAPSHTAVNVVGRFGDNFIDGGQLPSDLDVFNTSGNALTTAVGVDYDLWRMYGINLPQQVDAPFLENPNTQLAPYAVSVLNRARKEVFKGNLSIIGNEFQQPGEVIYVENDDLLYYVESVQHSFTYGSNFTTQLSLTYGHNPGEYIPTPLDVVGKILYKNNTRLAKIDNRRQGNSFNQQNLGAVVAGISSESDDPDLFTNSFAESNRITMDAVIKAAIPALSQQSTTFSAVLEIRIYYNTAASYGINSNLESNANAIKEYLLGSEPFNGGGIAPSLSAPISSIRLANFGKTNPEQIVFREVNTDPSIQGEFRYPSRKAFYLAKNTLSKNASSQTIDQMKIDSAVNNYIIDFWICTANPLTKG